MRRLGVAPAAGLLLITIVAFAPTIGSDFLLDDDVCVRGNETLRTPAGLAKIWLDPQSNQQYYPVVFSTFWVEYQLWGPNPTGYHLINILVHGVNGVLLWLALRRLGVPAPWFVAALFAVHPVQVESVGWIQELKNVLAGFFFFAAIYAYIRYALPQAVPADKEIYATAGDRPTTSRRGWYVLALLAGLCAFLSKTATCPLPVVLALLVWWKHGRLRRQDLVPLLPLFVLSIAAGLVTVWVEKRLYLGVAEEAWNLSFAARCLLAGRALWFYAGKLIWPAGLTIIYPRWQLEAGVSWQYLFPLLAIAVLVALWALRGRLGRGPLAGVLYFVGMLLPVLGFVNYFNMRQTYVADHFLYFACVGLFALGTAGLARLLQAVPLRPGVVVFGAGAIVALLSVTTAQQGWLYRDHDKLWADTLAKNPACWMAHHNLGTSLGRQKQYQKAIEHVTEAVRLRPDYVLAHYNLGKLLALVGEFDLAKAHLREVIRLEPGHPDARFVLGVVCFQQEHFDEAATYLTEEIALHPDSAQALHLLGKVRAQQARWAEAVACFRRACALQPNVSAYQRDLAEALKHVDATAQMEERLNETPRRR
ncbi:MAG TPA: tetratricopeptide repeat protein [Gemmataceae bacterium]|nr:tetratricopeptide repeat protein [Gemmataceae bacterium]